MGMVVALGNGGGVIILRIVGLYILAFIAKTKKFEGMVVDAKVVVLR